LEDNTLLTEINLYRSWCSGETFKHITTAWIYLCNDENA